MRFFLFLLVTLVFTACGHHKIQFSKVKTTKQKVVEISEVPSLKKSSEVASTPITEEEEVEMESAATYVEGNESDKSFAENNITVSNETQVDFPKTLEDSVAISPEEVNAITDEALRAEKHGAWSLITSILGPVLFICTVILFAFAIWGGIGPAAAVFSIILALATLACLVLSYVLGISSLRAQYNTPRGRKFAIAGIIISSAFLALFLINIGFGLF